MAPAAPSCPDRDEAWLRLVLTPGLPPSRARALLARWGEPQAILHGAIDADRIGAVVGPELAVVLHQAADPRCAAAVAAALRWLRDPAAQGRFLLTIADPDYPARLLELPGAPLLLFGEGRRSLLATPTLAIVGSRNATRQGRDHALGFARELARAGLAVASGMARGIDAAAHLGALDAGGATIAVLGTGPDVVYPRGHRELATRIARQGLLLTELPPGTAPLPHHFPRRNRIIAGLSLGVLIVEAALRSGSLLTARLCADAGREVFAIPGSIHAPLSRGCHELIRQGAQLVESPIEILQALRLAPADAPDGASSPGAGTSAPARTLLDALGHDPTDFDTLALRSGLAAGTLAALLLELEFCGRVEHLGANRYQRLTQGRG